MGAGPDARAAPAGAAERGNCPNCEQVALQGDLQAPAGGVMIEAGAGQISLLPAGFDLAGGEASARLRHPALRI